MSFLEDDVYQLRLLVQQLALRVAKLEKLLEHKAPPLKKRVELALTAARNDLAAARDRAKDQGDTELVEALQDLMAKVG